MTTADVMAGAQVDASRHGRETHTRVACVLDWAKAMGYRAAERERRSASRPHGVPVKCYSESETSFCASMDEVPALTRELEVHDSSAARALQWTILTAARAGETLGATRSEIKSASEFARIANLPRSLVQGEIWVVPAERMKEGKEHHVPLSQEAVALIVGRKGSFSPVMNVKCWTCLTSCDLVTPFTAFARASRIGRPSTTIRKSYARWRLLILSVTWSSKPIGGAHASTKDEK